MTARVTKPTIKREGGVWYARIGSGPWRSVLLLQVPAIKFCVRLNRMEAIRAAGPTEPPRPPNYNPVA